MGVWNCFGKVGGVREWLGVGWERLGRISANAERQGHHEEG